MSCLFSATPEENPDQGLDFGDGKAELTGAGGLAVLQAPAAHEGARGAGRQLVCAQAQGCWGGHTVIFRLLSNLQTPLQWWGVLTTVRTVDVGEFIYYCTSM